MSFQSLVEAFTHQVESRPDATALWVESSDEPVVPISWRQLARAVHLTSTALNDRFNANPSLPRRIGHASDNTVADIVLALAAMDLGAIEIPLDARLNTEEIERRFQRVGGHWVDSNERKSIEARALLGAFDSSSSLRPDRIRGKWVGDVRPDDPSLILWTSGTTGCAQGVTLSQRALVGNAEAKLAAVPQHTSDVRLTVLPLSHAYARTCDFGTWLLSGCELGVTLGYAGLKRMATSLRPHLINTVPRIAYRLLEENPKGLDRLRLLGCGGAPISPASFLQWQDRGVTVIQGYGLTETGPVICSATPENASPGLVGNFVEGWESRIIDGQLFVRGPHVMLHYWNDEAATWRKVDADGWLATGDLVELDESHDQLRILGRSDDVIVLDSGIKICPSAIEREVERIEGVSHALLHFQQELQLWFDASDEANLDSVRRQISETILRSQELSGCTVHRFSPHLSASSGELTAKGTIRRSTILEQRFANYAGS
ncbi:MAG: AMP-binding protein [Rubripirellula sp.]